jgi:hypothetical protein
VARSSQLGECMKTNASRRPLPHFVKPNRPQHKPVKPVYVNEGRPVVRPPQHTPTHCFPGRPEWHADRFDR